MSDLPSIVVITITSCEVAELTGKRHDHVLRDIDSILKEISPELGYGFKSSTYTDNNNRSYRQVDLDRDSAYCLVAGYDANARMRIIKRWQELEAKIEQPTLKIDGLSKKKQKKLKERMDEIREKRKARDLPRLKLVTPFELRYDETYFKGMAWLDSQAGTELSEKNIVVELSDEV